MKTKSLFHSSYLWKIQGLSTLTLCHVQRVFERNKSEAHSSLAEFNRCRGRQQLIQETMTKISTDFKERITEEITSFVQNQACSLSVADLDRLIADLPALRERFAKIPSQTYPYLSDQLDFLSLVVEEHVADRDPAAAMVGEAAFALLYFRRATDLIPDSIPGMGLLDDAIIVRIVLGRHEHAFKSSSHAYKLSWPAPSFDVDQLLSVVSPLRLTSFYLSMATDPRLTVPN
jgi:uncharacterized membrane protein YkvA (DUF1232 family)